MNLYLPRITGFIVFFVLIFRIPGNIRISDPTQCESDRKKAMTASSSGSLQWTLNLIPSPLEGSLPSPTLPIMPCYGLSLAMFSWWHLVCFTLSPLPDPPPSSISLRHATVMQCFTLTLITGCLHKQTDYHKIKKLNPLDDAACIVVMMDLWTDSGSS